VPPPAETDRDREGEAILALLRERDEGKTICPSEVARKLAGDGDFRPLMDPVRDAAARLAEEGAIEVTQGGEPVRVEEARGPIRLGLPER
jgi:hypothetical protein